MVAGVAAVAAAAAIAACSSTATTLETSASAGPTATSPAAPAAAHNHADVMFSHQMIPHHQQAIEMSDMILAKQGIDSRVIDLAKQIKAAQGPEIDQMQGWLNDWGMAGMPGNMPSDHGGMHGSPATSTMPSGSMMPGMNGMPGMDGMMSAADMQALQNAQGVAADKLFLTQMIEHHQGAITMAQNEIRNGQFPATIELAKSIASSQQKEIDTMKQILGTL